MFPTTSVPSLLPAPLTTHCSLPLADTFLSLSLPTVPPLSPCSATGYFKLQAVSPALCNSLHLTQFFQPLAFAFLCGFWKLSWRKVFCSVGLIQESEFIYQFGSSLFCRLLLLYCICSASFNLNPLMLFANMIMNSFNQQDWNFLEFSYHSLFRLIFVLWLAAPSLSIDVLFQVFDVLVSVLWLLNYLQ